jgi:hypothetical protein
MSCNLIAVHTFAVRLLSPYENLPALDERDAARHCRISQYRLRELLIRRWFPRPTIRNSKGYWYLDELDAWLADQQTDARVMP